MGQVIKVERGNILDIEVYNGLPSSTAVVEVAFSGSTYLFASLSLILVLMINSF